MNGWVTAWVCAGGRERGREREGMSGREWKNHKITSQPTTKPTDRPPANRSINQSTDLPVRSPFNPSSIHRPTRSSTNNPFTNQPANQPTNQPNINQPTNQSIHRPTGTHRPCTSMGGSVSRLVDPWARRLVHHCQRQHQHPSLTHHSCTHAHDHCFHRGNDSNSHTRRRCR